MLLSSSDPLLRMAHAVDYVHGCQCGVCLASLAADATDHALDGSEMTDALLGEIDDWREIADPLVAPLVAAMARAASLDEALRMVGAHGPDGRRLLERLAVATATARGIGDAVD